MSVHEANLRAIYGDEASRTCARGQWIKPLTTKTSCLFEAKNTLASRGRKRARAGGLWRQHHRRFDRGKQLAFEPAFKRLLSWMVAGDADTDDELAMAFKTVALMGLGNHTNNVTGWLGDHYPSTATLNCDDPLTAAACVAGTDLVLVGAAGQDEDAETIGLAVMHAFEIGVPVAYMHTRAWNETPSGNEVLAAMDMSIGPYGGNFWAQDQAVWPSIGAFIDAGGPLDAVATVLSHLQDEDFDFDFSACTYVGNQLRRGDRTGFRILDGRRQDQNLHEAAGRNRPKPFRTRRQTVLEIGPALRRLAAAIHRIPHEQIQRRRAAVF